MQNKTKGQFQFEFDEANDDNMVLEITHTPSPSLIVVPANV